MSKGLSNLFKKTVGWLKAERIIPGKDGWVTGGKSNVLGKNMLKTMGVSVSVKWRGYQAQHIIPAELKKHPILKKIGMNLDDASNGIFLRIPSNNVSVKTRHRGYHSVYNEFVKLELDKMNINDTSLNLQIQVRKLQNKLRKMQNSGMPIYHKQGVTIELLTKTIKRYE
ncbi:A nuclease family of the HNH/ENDO VII superfamily with conserved AHH [Lachnospiraceae bacterium RM5]|nr:A nuclease family of the HNH/ENDO VII superfamily with conserved AHH [Lachnospiraceae bacterium RM5]